MQLSLTSHQELDAIFSNITDVAELTITLIGSLEDTLEMAEDGQVRLPLDRQLLPLIVSSSLKSLQCFNGKLDGVARRQANKIVLVSRIWAL